MTKLAAHVVVMPLVLALWPHTAAAQRSKDVTWTVCRVCSGGGTASALGAAHTTETVASHRGAASNGPTPLGINGADLYGGRRRGRVRGTVLGAGGHGFETEPIVVQGTARVVFGADYFTGLAGRHYDVSPDGDRFLMIKPATRVDTEVPSEIIVVPCPEPQSCPCQDSSAS